MDANTENGTRTARLSGEALAVVEGIARDAKLSQRDVLDRLVKFGADDLRARLTTAGLISSD
jgi:hypothetical protein